MPLTTGSLGGFLEVGVDRWDKAAVVSLGKEVVRLPLWWVLGRQK